MRVLLTGAEGQLGRCFSDRAGESLEILATDRKQLDITDLVAVQKVIDSFKPDAIVNAAAYTAVDKAESDYDAAFAINCQAVKNLASQAGKLNIPFIHVSTDYVFNGESKIAYSESDNCDPKSVYGVTKRAGELEVLQSPKGIVIRTSWVFSEYGNNFVKTMLRLGAQRDALSIVGDQYGCPTYAGDLAQAIIEILSIPNFKPGLYHYSGDESVSWYQFALSIFATAHASGSYPRIPALSSITTEEYPTPAARPRYSVMNTNKLNAAGIAPGNWKKQLETIIPKILNEVSA
ncbi:MULTISPECIES: dTDP-4-dehydrorhamnose reductase [Rahnella]|jgi:dTDP-4-dehydrorhamnose reductase|uniref:dTDP-4-dehydrorhamnose reductase n=1 Tax=Rahnella sp. (strain Y9602) TaxID=2703885 RepID=A0ABW6C699_RAHSY|nr:dTDP-4-dehydrorhamnose reductase [Rahnella aceris]AYA06628.1 dTDP-4-dehydrorhamnose reductase [Rahnella aquatilis]AZP41867.1 dTDP-4-dehydrorhamnose reductase [Rahnella aquatilis]AZP46208.1 dTDP-4-dehydrorhamnose reductase [Rahnella aquatilis]AZP50684.1 dTDP-4-dehydrorhamnose reductase [Rahnella aquatilis]MBU9864191.1 dTDP-4-dehydrorhamnose reductase [Rahnella aceris]